MDRIRRLAMQVLERYRDRFTTDYQENKKTLDQVAIIRSKGLKNEIAGFITKFIKRESSSKTQEETETTDVEIEEEPQEESVPQEIVVENTPEESS